MSFYILLPLALIGAAGATGFGTTWLLGGDYLLNERDRLNLALGLAVGIPVVAAACVLVDRLPNISAWYGEFLQHLLHWSAAAFAIGLVFGAIYSWRTEEE